MRNHRLIRPRHGRLVAGVCRGVADYFGISVVGVRLIALILLFPGWLPGFIPYIILWAIIPSE